MSELRQDWTSGAWALIAPERSGRPRQERHREKPARAVPDFDSHCPFCPGNEHFLCGIIAEMPDGGSPGWRTRVVPNKYPLLRADGGRDASGPGAAGALYGLGHHEVVIETARHDADLATLADPDLAAVLFAYRSRYTDLAARPGIESVLVFRNYGSEAGASLAHPHSQIVASAAVPPRLAAIRDWACTHYAREGICRTCELLQLDLENGRRVVEATERFLVIVPFAAASAFEQWILPRRHQASFALADDRELAELAPLLQRALCRLKTTLDDPPYNYVIEPGAAGHLDAAWLHWRLRIVPDLGRPGGFELGTGLPVNPSRPEDDAAELRTAAASAKQGAG